MGFMCNAATYTRQNANETDRRDILELLRINLLNRKPLIESFEDSIAPRSVPKVLLHPQNRIQVSPELQHCWATNARCT